MRQAIWKFELVVMERQGIVAPPIIPLTLQLQNNKPCLWAIVAIDEPTSQHTIVMRGTGHEWQDDGNPSYYSRYLGTVQLDGFVWHYFW